MRVLSFIIVNASDLDFRNSLSCSSFQYAGCIMHEFAPCGFSSRLITEISYRIGCVYKSSIVGNELTFSGQA